MRGGIKNVMDSQLGYSQHPFHTLVLLPLDPDTVRSFLPCESHVTIHHTA